MLRHEWMVVVDEIIRLRMIVHMTRTMAVGATAGESHARAAEGAIDELNGCIRLIRCAATGRMVKQGVSMTHLHVMWRLEESGDVPMSRLADFLGVSFSNATGLIDRMEERGLVERIRDTDDRRVVFVRLTAAGQTILDEVQVMKRDLLTDVLGRLDEPTDRASPARLARLPGGASGRGEGPSRAVRRR